MNECGCHRRSKRGSFRYQPSVRNRRKKPAVHVLIYFPREVKQYEISEHQIGDGGPITPEPKDRLSVYEKCFSLPSPEPPYGHV